jgi:putative transposase
LSYPSDLKEKEWELIESYFQPKDRRGSACKHPRQQIVDAILYIVKTGAQWRQLPNDFPPWKTVYDPFSRWNKKGIWEQALDHLNRRQQKKKRPIPPSQLRHHRFATRQNPVRQRRKSRPRKIGQPLK